MKEKMLYERFLGWFILALIFAMALVSVSCEKAETYIPAGWDAGGTAKFDVQTGYPTTIKITNWPSHICPDIDGIYEVPNYISTTGWIYGRVFVAYILMEGKYKYIGWGAVQDTTLVALDNLRPEYVEINKP